MSPESFSLDQLNPSQREAVEHQSGPLLILAGAGSGKTRVITMRIMRLLQKGVAPEKILAVTFTNKAANEMRERVQCLVTKAAASALTICTFHSLCVRLLRQDIEQLGYKSNFTIFTGSDQIGLLKQIIVRKGGKSEKLDAHLMLSLISKSKNKNVPVSASGDDLAVAVAAEYERQLKLQNAVDFDDLLLLAGQLLEKNEEVRTKWQQRFHYLMVDEFQDTNRQQMQLLRALAGTRKNVCVVGDDDQSIYGWRGAEISNILEFERFFPDPKIVKLQENYRSVASILETANAVIRRNAGRREKTLIATKPGTETVRLISMPSDKEEAQLVVSEIWNGHNLQKRPYEDYAVLFRTNAQSRILEQILREHNIPYRLIGGTSFYERREVKDFLAYLHVCLNPDDDVNLLRIINNPPRGLSDKTVELATEASIEHRRSVFATLADPAFTAQFSKKTQIAAEKFTQQIHQWRATLTKPGADYASAAEEIIYAIDYLPYLKRTCSSPEEELNRESNLREVIQTLYAHQRSGGKGLRDFLDSISLDDDFSRQSESEKAAQKAGVWLITLHASKGLEFPHVYLVGLEQGILPHQRSLDEGTLDEERRLFYVGITRAMDKLTIMYCQSRHKYGQTISVQPSSFITELPNPPVEKISYEEMQTRPLKDDEVAAQFAQLRAFLTQRSKK